MAKLNTTLVLNRYILNLFGVTDLEALSEDLKDAALEGWDDNNVSHFHHRLVSRFYANPHLPKELLYQYDQNITAYTHAISRKRALPLRWKYFQYLTLLFTEIYLDRYFSDATALGNELNLFLQGLQSADARTFKDIESYATGDARQDLNKLAYWNATGSGKTLLMHIAILQYQYYLRKHGRSRELNRIILLTPNEGLSKQHLREFEESGLEAELFDKNAGSLFSGTRIEIIDIHKLEEKSGDKTVAVEAFEGNNLVLVDEGHRGSSGETWKDKRNRLCANGFSFEYSATFGQAVASQSSKGKQKALVNEYSKATLIDYSYKYFYEDGYGKDYQIMNLDESWNGEYVNRYLIACLLSFYEQLLVFREHGNAIEPFLIEKPLAIFVGGKVTKSISDTMASDVVQVLKFLADFVKESAKTIEQIQLLLDGREGLNDKSGHALFRNAFGAVRRTAKGGEEIYNDVLREVFNSNLAGAHLHLDNLKGQDGEIGLRIGAGEYFGVINVGDDAALIKKCAEAGLSTDEKEFSVSLFRDINARGSKINLLIGSKKFTEGWSSWRVSTMGLLNIGRGEGSEIIQLFGRGVRLKGYKFSLKRSAALEASIKPLNVPSVLPILETLNIFGLRADYMQQFREYLAEEGLSPESDYQEETIEIMPVLEHLEGKKLKYIRVKEGSNFKRETVVEILSEEAKGLVTLDWYPKVQMLRSSKTVTVPTVNSIEQGFLAADHLAFLDWDALYFEIQTFKADRSWYNLDISSDALRSILNDHSWYILAIPSAELEFTDYNKVRIWQEIASALLKGFIERVYNFYKQKYYGARLESAVLDRSHPNFEAQYNILIHKSQQQLIGKLRELKKFVQNKSFTDNFKLDTDFEAVYFSQHLYQPLLYMDKKRYDEVIKVQPVALNKGERTFVEDLKQYYLSNPDFFGERQLYLLRNMSRKGIGFFEANNFYPDFILWLVDGSRQYINFIDPKGIRQLAGLKDDKILLHKKIRLIQQEIGDPDIVLNSFILSNTPAEQVAHWRDQNGIADFNSQHVFFQPDQRGDYIRLMLAASLKDRLLDVF